MTIEQLKAHLALLRDFKQLRTLVEEGTDVRLPQDIRDLGTPTARWGIIVALAVERYDDCLLAFRWTCITNLHISQVSSVAQSVAGAAAGPVDRERASTR